MAAIIFVCLACTTCSCILTPANCLGSRNIGILQEIDQLLYRPDIVDI